jgi:two-component system response regulator NreC
MTSDGTWRIVLADDHLVVRAGLRTLLAADSRCRVVGEAASIDELLAVVGNQRPDLIVLDLSFGTDNVLDTVPKLLAFRPQPRLVVLTMHDNLVYARAAFTAGVHGYLMKEAAANDLLRAVEAVMAGSTYLHAELGARLARSQPTEVEGLSAREGDVLALLAKGYTNAEIAQQLMVSLRTVEAHRANLRGRLGVHSRAQIVEAARKLGLLP